MAPDIQIKRIYDPVAADDGYRVLIDHVWPRGVSHESARLDEWAQELAPSNELRRWFDHIPERFPEFRVRYRRELARLHTKVNTLEARARRGRVTILYAARDPEHNNAVVLQEVMRTSYGMSGRSDD